MRHWWWSLALLCACPRSPAQEPPPSGMAQLKGVVFQRIKGTHEVAKVEAQHAELDINGTRVTLMDVQGQVQERPDASAFNIQATKVLANLETNTFVAYDVKADDKGNRTLTTPRVFFSGDGGVMTAEPPVVLEGPNFEMRSEHGARADVQSEELELLGPVEAFVWPPDGGKEKPKLK